MSFLEGQFPINISYGSQGGPGFQTNVRTFNAGFEQRRVRWPYPRHRYNVIKGVQNSAQLEELINFFYGVQGKAYGFRYNDPLDHKTCAYTDTPAYDDVTLIADAAGGEQVIQLFKPYTLGTNTVERPIRKPISGTVTIGKNGSLFSAGQYSIDYTTGVLTLNSALVLHDSLTWGGEFDVPCRFDTDEISIRLQADLVGNMEVPVIEIKV